ncbi:MAG: ABC transporter ATP-binding protein [Actinobacteria bacterium]|nr:ABC transporter ATP-binding protein [Actinomycetota bacterium]
MVAVENVTKLFSNKAGVRDLNFSVQKGEILGLLGPNGAGKTTTMRIITGFMPPTSGTVRVNGFDVLEQPLEVRRRVGYLPENPPLYGEMTVAEYLSFVAELKGCRGARKKDQVDKVIEEVSLGDMRGRLLDHLSRGYRQRVGLAQALVGDPQLLVLDEPTAGLDPRQITEIRNLIKNLAGSRTVILSSHILPEVSMICQQVAIINRGRLVAQDTPENLSKRFAGFSRLEIEVKGPREAVEKELNSLESAQITVIRQGAAPELHRYIIDMDAGRDIREDIFFAMAGRGWPITEMAVQNASLEDVFLELVTEEDNGRETRAQ